MVVVAVVSGCVVGGSRFAERAVELLRRGVFVLRVVELLLDVARIRAGRCARPLEYVPGLMRLRVASRVSAHLS